MYSLHLPSFLPVGVALFLRKVKTMSDYDELEAAAQAARYLVSTAACIRGLIADGESEKIITELKRELNQKLTEASKAIRNVEMELRRTRTNAFRIGDISML